MQVLLGIDIGTNHCKVGVISTDGRLLNLESTSNTIFISPEGYSFYNPDELWEKIVGLVKRSLSWLDKQFLGDFELRSVGIASMAETGILVDKLDGTLRTDLIPWFDPVATDYAEGLCRSTKLPEEFSRRGTRPTYKCSLAKILWLRQTRPEALENSTWLSTADYIAYRLTGNQVTDYSLAGRTYAFDIVQKDWDKDFLTRLGIPETIFPSVIPSDVVMGNINAHSHRQTGLSMHTTVTVAGHDHICGSLAASVMTGGVRPNMVFDSMGTAESLVGAIPGGLSKNAYASGLSYGMHVVDGFSYWVGGLSSSGGSIEWIRQLLADPPLSYAELDEMIGKSKDEPGGILYFPYLLGSGSPHSDSIVRGMIFGLTSDHSRADLYRAVLEGTAQEIEFIRQSAQRATGIEIDHLIAAGGGTRNKHWMQIKADITGCQIDILPQVEATVLGAALLGGLGNGVYNNLTEMVDCIIKPEMKHYLPDPRCHQLYCEQYEQFMALQMPLRSFFRTYTD